METSDGKQWKLSETLLDHRDGVSLASRRKPQAGRKRKRDTVVEAGSRGRLIPQKQSAEGTEHIGVVFAWKENARVT